jgi:hypothetical protein
MGRPCPGGGPRSHNPIHLGQRTGRDTSSAHRSPWHRARRNSSKDSAARGPVTLTLNAFASAGILPTEVFNHRFWAAHWTDWKRTDCAQFYLLPLRCAGARRRTQADCAIGTQGAIRHELESS